MAYRGRFAPSPTGPMHAGSMLAALASWLDARAHGGRWLVRIEDIDTPRSVAGAADLILAQLAACQLIPDEPPAFQSLRGGLYTSALQQLLAQGHAYGCTCSRRQIAEYWQMHGRQRTAQTELPYPGSCRDRTDLEPGEPQAVRVRCMVDSSPPNMAWMDRRLGPQCQNLCQAVGDFIIRRSDGLWAYQLAVVVDDAEQGISDIVRGEDLADNTARQIHLQRLLGLRMPRYLHLPLVLGADGSKLSKQNGALAIDTRKPLQVLQAAGAELGIELDTADDVGSWLAAAIRHWTELYPS